MGDRNVFTVTGTFKFPLDMLHYDGCFPAQQSDVANIYRTLERAGARDKDGRREQLDIKLIAIDDDAPTPDRWKSFGWKVKGGE